MNESMDIDLNELRPNELINLDEELENQLRIYFRHLVGLAGAYEHIGAGGKRAPKEPFYFSAAVLEVADQWFLATAGHNIEKIDAALNRSDMRLVACGLDDTYTPESVHKAPIEHFGYGDASRFYRNEDSLDFGLIHLRKNYRDLLSANGVKPLTSQHWNASEVDACDTFLMLGFPEDRIESSITLEASYYNARVKGRPNVVVIDRARDLRDSISKKEHPRFVGQIRPEHDVGNIAGMSGGPIFCFKGDNFEPYWLAAIQCSWFESKRLTYACPIALMLDVAREFITGVIAAND